VEHALYRDQHEIGRRLEGYLDQCSLRKHGSEDRMMSMDEALFMLLALLGLFVVALFN
jgi:hypothetical protein